jgi:RASD family protein 2
MAVDEQRYRLVVLGAGKVGKSSIISRFLTGRFVENYRPTVEDLHCRTFHVDGSAIQVSMSDINCFVFLFVPNNYV